MLAKRYRLTKNFQFNYIYRKGKVCRTRNLSLIYVTARVGTLKIGFSVSNKIGKANVRNKVKRRLREAVRGFLPRLSRGNTMVFSVRPEITGDSFSEIVNACEYLLKKSGLIT